MTGFGIEPGAPQWQFATLTTQPPGLEFRQLFCIFIKYIDVSFNGKVAVERSDEITGSLKLGLPPKGRWE